MPCRQAPHSVVFLLLQAPIHLGNYLNFPPDFSCADPAKIARGLTNLRTGRPRAQLIREQSRLQRKLLKALCSRYPPRGPTPRGSHCCFQFWGSESFSSLPKAGRTRDHCQAIPGQLFPLFTATLCAALALLPPSALPLRVPRDSSGAGVGRADAQSFSLLVTVPM